MSEKNKNHPWRNAFSLGGSDQKKKRERKEPDEDRTFRYEKLKSLRKPPNNE